MSRMKSLLAALISLLAISASAQTHLHGAWVYKQDSITHLVLVTPGYYSYSVFAAHRFLHTEGGTWRSFAGTHAIETTTEFNSSDITKVHVKTTDSNFFSRFHDKLDQQLPDNGWTHTRSSNTNIEAVWRITGRQQDGDMKSIPAGARKTIKLLAGNWFHWAAINTATGEFFGSGGGQFSYVPGNYTETIFFFSRDNSRVGMTLPLTDQITQNTWDHQGKSSKGDPIHEIWTKDD